MCHLFGVCPGCVEFVDVWGPFFQALHEVQLFNCRCHVVPVNGGEGHDRTG